LEKNRFLKGNVSKMI